MIARFEKFISCITLIDLYWHRIASSAMKPFGLKGNYAVYFTCLLKHPDGATSAQLCSECDKDKADVSRDVNALEQLGFIKRQLNSGSSYRARIILTESGREIAEKVSRLATQAVDSVGGCLTEEERASFYHGLEVITANLQKVSEEGISLQDET